MTDLAYGRAPVRRAAPRLPTAPAARRALLCVWAPCPATGVIACRWMEAGLELALVAGSPDRGEHPPSRLPLAA